MILMKKLSGYRRFAFLSLVTVNADGPPHPIVTGKGEVVGETVIFGIYKMEMTQKNLTVDKNAWVVAANQERRTQKGYRSDRHGGSKGQTAYIYPDKG